MRDFIPVCMSHVGRCVFDPDVMVASPPLPHVRPALHWRQAAGTPASERSGGSMRMMCGWGVGGGGDMMLRQFIPQEAFVSSLVRKVNLSSVNDK